MVDELVQAALRKWPNVPHCYDWLAGPGCARALVHARRARAARRAFPQVKAVASSTTSRSPSSGATTCVTTRAAGSSRTDRSACMSSSKPRPGSGGCSPMAACSATPGQLATVEDSRIDETRRLYLVTDLGFGLVHSLDVQQAAGICRARHLAPRAWRGRQMAQTLWLRPPPAAAPATHSQKAKGSPEATLSARFERVQGRGSGSRALGSSNLAPPWLAM